MSAPVIEIAAVCREANSAWLATSALLELAEAQGVRISVWEVDDDGRTKAESVRESLERALLPPGGADPRVGGVYDPTATADAVKAVDTPLAAGELAYVVAAVLDQLYWASFTRDWLADRGPVFELRSGERYPVGEMRLLGAVGHSARPHRLGLPVGELAHVRQRGVDGVRVIVNGDFAPIIDGLAGSPPLQAAALLPNESWSELAKAPKPIGPADATTQLSAIVELLEQASVVGIDVAVLPELSVDESIVARLAREWADSTNRPMLFAGSVHLVDDNRHVNRTTVLIPGVGAAWSHDKSAVFEDREGNREPIDPGESCVTLGCGDVVRVATLICKDALGIGTARLVADLGVHLLAVPAMSDRLGDFSNAASELIARSQGAMVVANNPRLWDDADVEHALLGHPVREASRFIERRSLAAPDLGVARLGMGWVL